MTADEFYNDDLTPLENMVEFAKFHVTEALKAASKLSLEDVTHPEANDYEEAVEMTILECYPLSNIK